MGFLIPKIENMANGKKIFNMYPEWIETFENLTDEDAGQLIKHIFKYVNDQNPESNNPMVNLGFIPIKQQLKRDLIKWLGVCERNKKNGKKGGRPIANNPNNPSGLSRNPNEPKKADKDKDKDKDKTKGFLGINIPFKNFWEMYGKKEGFDYTEGRWNNLDPETQKTIMDFLPKYIASKPNPRYRKKPENFLIDETWKEELPEMNLSEIKDKDDPRFKLLTRDQKIKWIKANIKF